MNTQNSGHERTKGLMNARKSGHERTKGLMNARKSGHERTKVWTSDFSSGISTWARLGVSERGEDEIRKNGGIRWGGGLTGINTIKP